MKNYQASAFGFGYNDKLRLDNSSYHAQPHSIIVNYFGYGKQGVVGPY